MPGHFWFPRQGLKGWIDKGQEGRGSELHSLRFYGEFWAENVLLALRVLQDLVGTTAASSANSHWKLWAISMFCQNGASAPGVSQSWAYYGGPGRELTSIAAYGWVGWVWGMRGTEIQPVYHSPTLHPGLALPKSRGRNTFSLPYVASFCNLTTWRGSLPLIHMKVP